MNIIVSGSHFESFPKAEEYVKEKTQRLSKYHPKIEKVQVRLTNQKAHRSEQHGYTCEIIVSIPGNNLEILERDMAPDAAFDKALDRMKRLLVKSKEKEITKKHKIGIEDKVKIKS